MKALQNFTQRAKSSMARVALASAGLVASASSFATGSTGSTGSTSSGPDFSAVTNQVSFSTVVTGIMAVAVLLAGLYVAIAGAKVLLRFIRSA